MIYYSILCKPSVRKFLLFINLILDTLVYSMLSCHPIKKKTNVMIRPHLIVPCFGSRVLPTIATFGIMFPGYFSIQYVMTQLLLSKSCGTCETWQILGCAIGNFWDLCLVFIYVWF